MGPQLVWTLRVEPRLFERPVRSAVNTSPELSRLHECTVINDVTYAVAFLSSALTCSRSGMEQLPGLLYLIVMYCGEGPGTIAT